MADTILLAAMLLALAVVVAGVFRKLPLPHSVVLVLVGMGLAELARRWPSVAPDAGLAIGPDLVFFVLLPALVFESGLSLDVRRLLQNLAPVLTLALPALLLSTAIIGLGLWLATHLDLTVALLFGALISATDPVAVVALFKEMGAPARLTVLVEGESLFNDATAIVVFALLLAFALEGGLPGAGALARALPGLVVVFVGGAALGVVTGAVASELSHRLRSPTPATLAMSVAAAYASFILAEHALHVSGVMAAVGASITFAALAITRLSGPARHALAQTWELVAFVCNALLFLLLGLAVDLSSLLARLPLIAAAVVLVHLARAAAVYVLVPLTTRVFALPPVAMGDRHIMWWGGLKGGLAIAIALSVPESLAERQLLLEVTMGVVLFTLLVNAPTLRLLMHRLRLDRFSRDEQAELGDALVAARAQVESRLHAYRADALLGAEAHHVLADEISQALAPPRGGTRRAQTLRAAHLAALNAEADALATLFDTRAIDQYTFLELRDILLRDREQPTGDAGKPGEKVSNLFARLEAAVLRGLRDRDWASALLARYQDVRFQQLLERNLAGVIMARAAGAALQARPDADSAAASDLAARYRERALRRRERLAGIRRDYPALYRRFETATFSRAVLVDALHAVERAHEQGKLGRKACAALTARIEAALDAARRRDIGPKRVSPAAWLARVALFQGLSGAGLEALAAECRPMTFLPGDDIVVEGEHGDALYVITRGAVAVSRRVQGGASERLARLREGDFFGEAALLGDPVRNATVTADDAVTVLRLQRAEVLALDDDHPEIGARLREADQQRSAAAG